MNSITPQDVLPRLNRNELAIIHEKSIELLNTVGFRFADSRRAVDIFKQHGFKTDGDVVYFNEGQIQKAVATAPSRFRVRALNPDKEFTLGDGAPVFTNNAAPGFISDISGVRNYACKTDFIDFLKIAQQTEILELIRPMFDVCDKPDGRFEWLLRWALEYTDKAVSGASSLDMQLIAAAFDTSKKEMQDKAADQITHAVGVCNPRSPLTLESSNCDFCIDQADWGVACKISPVPIAGMTGPITLPGLLILQNAEVLAPLVLSQLVNPGTPVIFGVMSTTADMKTMCTVASPPEQSGRIVRAGVQMANYYQIPSRVDVGNTDACGLDYQAGAEAAYSLANAVLSGGDLMASLGSLESRGMGSLEKLVLDAQLAAQVKATLADTGFKWEASNTSAMDELALWVRAERKTENSQPNHGLNRQDTIKNMRKIKPDEKRQADLRKSARLRVESLIADYKKPDVLPRSQLAALDRLIAKRKHV